MTFAEDHGYYYAVIVSNSISILACILAVAMYTFLRRKNLKLMSRTSLKISVAMASTNLLFHVCPPCAVSFPCTHCSQFRPFQAANLAGYGNLPEGFLCAFVGGWLFAFPSILSVFYACAIALNTQLVFIHRRKVKENRQTLFLIVPVALALLISTSPYSCSDRY